MMSNNKLCKKGEIKRANKQLLGKLHHDHLYLKNLMENPLLTKKYNGKHLNAIPKKVLILNISQILLVFKILYQVQKTRNRSTVDTTRIKPFSTYVCTDRIFDSPPFMYNKIFLKKLLQKLLAPIFTLLLAPFASKLVNYWRHRESLKNVRKCSNRCFDGKCRRFRILPKV